MLIGIIESVVSGIIVAIALETLKHRLPKNNAASVGLVPPTQPGAPLPYPLRQPTANGPHAHLHPPHGPRYSANPYHPNPPQSGPTVPRRRGAPPSPAYPSSTAPQPAAPAYAATLQTATAAAPAAAPMPVPAPPPRVSFFRRIRRIAVRLVAAPFFGFFWGCFTAGFISGFFDIPEIEYGSIHCNALIALGTVISWGLLTLIDYMRDHPVRRIHPAA